MHLLLNAEVYSPDRLGRRHLLIAGTKIVWMGVEPPSLDAVLAVETLDLQGQRLVPGFIDLHAHITGGGGESGFASRVPPVSLSRFTSNGVTTVVGVLGTDDVVRNTASLLAQARALGEEGITCYCYTGGYHVPPTTLTGCVQTDIVHVDAIVGVGELAISDHRSSQPTLDELLRVASQAHVAGLMSGKAGIVHLHLGDGERGLELVRQALQRSELPARVFHPTHVNRKPALFDEALALARLGSYVDLTAFPADDEDDALSAAEGLIRYVGSDAPPGRVTVSSDGGGCIPHFDNDGRMIRMGVGDPSMLLDTLRAVCAAGLDLNEALPAFTANVADLLRLPFKGRITPDADADLLVVDEHFRVRHVMALGRWHLRDGRQLVRGQFETDGD